MVILNKIAIEREFMGKWGYIIGLIIIGLFAAWGYTDIPVLEDLLDLLGYPFTLMGVNPGTVEASIGTGGIIVVIVVVALVIFPGCRNYVWHSLMGGGGGGSSGGYVVVEEEYEVYED
jgi:hypothetical protein